MRSALPGAGHPPIYLGDKNYTEQEILGQLYAQALEAEGYTVIVNQNIGATPYTMQALRNGTLMAYPEYLSEFDSAVAGYRASFGSASAAYAAAQRWAGRHGLVLLSPTPFSDTGAIAVTDAYAVANDLHSIADLGRVATALTIGGPAQFQVDPPGLEQLSLAYGLTPTAFRALPVPAQYAALNAGTVQAADVKTTDGELASGDYVVLRDPQHVFGFGNVIPVISAAALAKEGQAFADTIARVDETLTTPVMRELDQLVDVAQLTPTAVARQFLQTHGLLTPQSY
ncbi:MAG: glycine betaine ABC transporter substrate-binding protein [Solirubrobacteraceae bacterium]